MDNSLNALSDPGINAADPVCGMQFPPENAAGKLAYEGKTYYFCNKSCLEKFRLDPLKYLVPVKPSKVKIAPGYDKNATAALYTCPMDPEVRRNSPGP